MKNANDLAKKPVTRIDHGVFDDELTEFGEFGDDPADPTSGSYCGKLRLPTNAKFPPYFPSMKSKFGIILAGSLLLVAVLLGAMNYETISAWFAPRNTTGDLRLYCAAGISEPMSKIAKQYEEEFGVKVQCDFAGSGALLSTIEAADSGDLYLAASESYIQQAKDDGLATSSAPIAWQRPVICFRKDSKKKIESLQDLLREDVRVSIANPEVAAISRAAKKAIAGQTHEGGDLWEAIYEAKTVARDTVNAVTNDVKGRTVDAGIVWDATAAQYPEFDVAHIPEWDAAKKNIQISVLKSTKNEKQALHFLRYVTSNEKGLTTFQEFGYEVVRGDKWPGAAGGKPELVVFAGGLNRPAVQATIARFEEDEGVEVIDSYNGCGVLVGQIKTGEVPDLYFACDITFMEQVQDEFPVWTNVSGTDMVIIVNGAKAKELDVKSLQDLSKPGLKVGFTHPQKSALGALTRTLLEKNDLWEAIEPNVKDTPATADVLVSQVVIGGLDAAIVYKANTTLQLEKLEVVAIDDPAAHAVQPISIAAKSEYPLLTARLIERIRSAQSQAKFEELGFDWLDGVKP